MAKSNDSTGFMPVPELAEATRRRMERPVDQGRIERSLRILAQIVAEGDHRYLPIFVRLERELELWVEKSDALRRARRWNDQK